MSELSFTKSPKTRRYLMIVIGTLLICLTAFLFFFKIATPAPVRWDEQTNYAVVRDTLASQNILFLQKGGEPFFEKPPLWYYTSMVSVSVFGDSNFSLRLVSALSGCAITALIFFFIKKHKGKAAAFFAAFSFLAIGHNFITFPEGVYFSTHTYRSADLDALQIFLILLSFILAAGSAKSANKLYLSAFFAGLAFLAKGPLAAVTFIISLLFIYRFTKEFTLKRKQLFLSLLIFIATILPWHLLMLIKYGDLFISNFVNNHLLQRSLTTLEGHEGGILFYIVVLTDFVRFTAWPFILGSLYLVHKQKKKNPDVWLPVILAGTILILFSVAGTKLAWYVLPLYPFLSIITGFASAAVIGWKRILFCTAFLAFVVIGLIHNILYILAL